MKKSLSYLTFCTRQNITLSSLNPKHFTFSIARILLSSFFIFSLSSHSSAQITNGFELDGNAQSVAPNPPDDWDLINSGTSHAQVSTGIVLDLPPGNDNAFQQGSADINDIPTWHWTLFTTPDKDDILHAGAALYNNTQIFFFGDRYATNGDAQIGFWFFKNAVGPNPDGSFYGTHAVGDILLLSDFVNGGGVSVIAAYEWVGSGGSDGSLNHLNVNGSNLYAIVNSSNEPSPWSYIPKTGPANVFGPGAFYEGGIDLAGLGAGIDPCFTSFLLETRSSQSLTAELKDFVFGGFFTQPQVTVNSASICPGGGPVILTATVAGGSAPLTYSWSNGATTSSISVNPSVTTTYTVVVTASNGCVANPASGTVTVNTPPPCSITGISPSNLICNHGNYTISSSASGTLSWTMVVDGSPAGWGIVGSSTGQTITFSAGNCGNAGFQVHFTLTVTDAQGCTSTCMASFAPGAPACNVSIRPPIVLTCTHTSQYILTSYATGILNPTFSWTRNGSPLGTGINNGSGLDSILVNMPGSYQFVVGDPANSSNDCFASVVVTQNIVAPGVMATGGQINCTHSSAQLTASSPTNGVTYHWTGPNGYSSNLQNPMVTGSGLYTVVATNPVNGCTSTAAAFVGQNIAQPSIQASGGELTCAVTSLQLNASSITNGVTYSWTGPNGFSSSLQNPMINVAGTYTVTVTNPANGCTNSTTATVTQNITAPGVTAAGAELNCIVTSVHLIANSPTNGVTFSWTGPNGFTSTLSNPMVSSAGLYTVIVTNPVNGCTSTTVAFVLQNTVHPSALATGGVLTCAATSVQLNASSSTVGVSYNWTGPNGFTSNLQHPVVNVAGIYFVTVTNPRNGCTGSAHAAVTSNTTAPGAQAAGGQLTCAVTSIQLNASSSTSGVTYSWTGPNGFSSTQQNPTVNTAGTYSVTVTNPLNGCTSMATAVVTSNTVSPGAQAAGGHLTCSVTSIQLSASSPTSGVTYNWIGPNGFSSTQQNPTVTVAGLYHVIITNPANGCTSVAPAVVTSNTTAPGVQAAGGELNCAVSSVQLSASSPTSGVSYSWTGPNGFTSAQQNPTVTVSGTYFVTVTNPVNGCISAAMVIVFLNNAAPGVTATGGQINCAAASVQLTASSSTNGVTFTWSGPNGFSSTQQNPTVTTVGTYTVIVTNPANGCTSMATATVTQNNNAPTCSILPPGYPPYCGTGGHHLSVTASGGTGPYAFSWSVDNTQFGWAITAGGNTSTITYTAGTAYNALFTVVVTDANGCTSSCTFLNGCTTSRPEGGGEDVMQQPNPVTLNAYPNPFANNTTVEFAFSYSTNAQVDIYSMTGAKVTTLFKGEAKQDLMYKVNFDASKYAEGIYFCRVSASNKIYYLKLMLTKE